MSLSIYEQAKTFLSRAIQLWLFLCIASLFTDKLYSSNNGSSYRKPVKSARLPIPAQTSTAQAVKKHEADTQISADSNGIPEDGPPVDLTASAEIIEAKGLAKPRKPVKSARLVVPIFSETTATEPIENDLSDNPMDSLPEDSYEEDSVTPETNEEEVSNDTQESQNPDNSTETPSSTFKPESLKIGKVAILPRLGFEITYDDNINITERNPLSDIIMKTSPGLRLGLGEWKQKNENYLILDYQSNIIKFADHSEEDATEHLATFDGAYHFNKLEVGLQHAYEFLSSTSPDLGGRVNVETQNTTFDSLLEITGKMDWEFKASQIITNYADNTKFDSNEWVFSNWLDYQMFKKIKTSLGATVGILDVAENPNQLYQQALTKIEWVAREKFLLRSSLGVEFRQFEGDSQEMTVDPIFSLGFTYTPFKRTSFSVDGYRKTANSSSSPSENISKTGFNVSIDQQVTEKLKVALSGGLDISDYVKTSSPGQGQREDLYYFIKPQATYEFNEWWIVQLFYQFRENDSNISNSSFTNHQVGFQSSVKF